MDIGKTIRELRRKRRIKQEDFAEALCVSVQTVSRWENGVNYPDISFLPQIATYFKVSTDYLLGFERRSNMAKLIRTTEMFELNTRKEAEEMVLKFKGETFPILKEHKITDYGDKFILEVTKEFNTLLDSMKFE